MEEAQAVSNLAAEKGEANDDDSDDEDYNPFERLTTVNQKKPSEPSRKQPARKAGNIFSLNDMHNDEEESGEDKGQAFYAGGSSTSGQQILGPKKQNPESIIKDLFEKAKE